MTVNSNPGITREAKRAVTQYNCDLYSYGLNHRFEYAMSRNLKKDTAFNGIGMGLIALGILGMGRLSTRAALPRISWLNRPAASYASIAAGFSFVIMSTLSKVALFTHIDWYLKSLAPKSTDAQYDVSKFKSTTNKS